MRHWCASALVILFLQVCDHAWCKEETCADEKLHPECKEESTGRVVCIECTASEASREIGNNEEYATVTCMVRPAKDAWVSKGGDLKLTVSVLRGSEMEVRGVLQLRQ